jgi:tetratricopeptide (TPR) repeat protein
VAAYKAAIAAVPPLDPYDIRDEAARGLRRVPDARHAEAYRLSLHGWRRLERNELPAASAALERSIGLHPHDPVARYRFGRVLQARRDDAAALEQFDHAIRRARACPAPILGNAYLESARLRERLGQRDEAISAYTVASTLFGAAAETRGAAARALARLQPH